MKKPNTLFLVEIAIFGALAYLLDLLAGALSLKIWAQGGSISISMVPVLIMAFRWGVKGGLITGFLLGLLQVVTGQAFIVHIVQALLDYFVAFTLLGFAGVFAKPVLAAVKNNNAKKLVLFVTLAAFFACFLRFFPHYFAGIIFFSMFAPEGQPVEIYSFLYNVSFLIPSFIFSAIITVLLIRTVPRIFSPNKSLA